MHRHMMKRLVAVAIVCACCACAWALPAQVANRSFGFGLSAIGQKGVLYPAETFGGMGINVSYAPFHVDWFEPSLNVEVTVGGNQNGAAFGSVRTSLGLDLFRTLHHPFGLLTTNDSLWSVGVNVGFQYEFARLEPAPLLYLSCTLIRLKDKDYWYEWVSPFMTLDCTGSDVQIDSWGIVLFRFTYLMV